jgi:hypothetical protein
MDFNQNQEALYNKMFQSKVFSQLEQIVQQRNEAVVDHKAKKAHAAFMSNMSQTLGQFAQQADKATLGAQANATANGQDGSTSGASNGGLGSAQQNNSTNESSQNPLGGNNNNTVGGSESTPNNWPQFGSGPVDQYDMSMYNYFMLAMSGGMDNPNSIIYFLEALAKLMTCSNQGEQNHLNQFTKALLGASLTQDPITGMASSGGVPYSKAIAELLVAVALYNQAKTGQSADSFLSQIKSQLSVGGSNPFIGQVLANLNGQTEQSVQAELTAKYGNLSLDTFKTVLSFMTEALSMYSNGALEQAGVVYKQSYIAMLRQRYMESHFNDMKQQGANALELIEFLLGAVCGGIDDHISSYGVAIGALAQPGTALGNMKGALAPNDNMNAQTELDWVNNMVNYYKQLQLYTNNPILQADGVADAIKKFLSQLSSTSIVIDPWDDKKNQVTISFQDILDGKASPIQAEEYAKALLGSVPDPSGKTDEMNPALQALLNDVGIPEQEISSQNDMEKTLFTNANQQGSQNLSAAGGIIKDLLKLFALTVQNQRT